MGAPHCSHPFAPFHVSTAKPTRCVLPMYIVYRSGRHHRGKLVVRRYTDVPDAQPLALVDSLDEAAVAIRAVDPEAQRFDRDFHDNPEIVEKWL